MTKKRKTKQRKLVLAAKTLAICFVAAIFMTFLGYPFSVREYTVEYPEWPPPGYHYRIYLFNYLIYKLAFLNPIPELALSVILNLLVCIAFSSAAYLMYRQRRK